jgi:hypothetical protein
MFSYQIGRQVLGSLIVAVEIAQSLSAQTARKAQAPTHAGSLDAWSPTPGLLMPVALLPGRARPSTRPSLTGAAEYNGNRRGCGFGRNLGCVAGGRCNNCDMTAETTALLVIATTRPGRARRAAQVFPP